MNVRVVSVARLRHPDCDPVIYVGRAMPGLAAHPLANPFKARRGASEAERAACLAQHAAWLDAHPDRDGLLMELAGAVKRTGLPLSCWCGCWPENPNLICHAVELAKRVQKILEDA